MKPKFHVCIISTAPSRVKSRFGGGPCAVGCQRGKCGLPVLTFKEKTSATAVFTEM
jgi:hypothetical protein